ncbi:MAG: hypothetical protein EZS28_047807, partial [Streblomastix strix]
MEAGPISARNRKRTDRQINERQSDNAEEEEEQTDETSLNQNKDYRANVITQNPVEQNQVSQSQSSQSLNVPNQLEKVDVGPALIGVQEKPKRGRGSKKAKTEGLNASVEQNQGNNAQSQTKTASKVPKTKAAPKRSKKAAEE